MLHFVLIIMGFSSIFVVAAFFFSNTYYFSDALVLGAAVYVLRLANILLFSFSFFFTQTYVNLQIFMFFSCIPPKL
uniref:Uncharacterized protein n=1 Tax=Rhipicephalus microplus TaxID=6941 RepID=A0A6M2DB91_RHIMP